MDLATCLMTSASSADLVEQFDRLYGTNLARKGGALALAIDDASGRTRADLGAFVDFVATYVHHPMIMNHQQH